MTFINVSDNYIPKAELESNENKIPKAIAQHFPDVQGDNIDNNKEAKERNADELKGEASSKDTPRYEVEDRNSLPIIDEKESQTAEKKETDIKNEKKKKFLDKQSIFCLKFEFNS